MKILNQLIHFSLKKIKLIFFLRNILVKAAAERSYPTPKKKKCKKPKWLSEKALQIAVKRKEVKSKGEKERYSHLNAEFQRRSRRDKKAFLSAKK